MYGPFTKRQKAAKKGWATRRRRQARVDAERKKQVDNLFSAFDETLKNLQKDMKLR